MQKLVEMKYAKVMLIAVAISLVGTSLVVGRGRNTRAEAGGKVKVEGKLEVITSHFTDGSSDTELNLVTKKGKRLKLKPMGRLDQPLLSGTEVAVSGTVDEQGDFAFLTDSSDFVVTNAVTASPDSVGEQKTLVVMMNFTNTPQPALTKAIVDDVVFNQMNSFYRENSYNQAFVTGSSFGWYNIPYTSTCFQTTVRRYALEAAALDTKQKAIGDVNADAGRVERYGSVALDTLWNTSYGAKDWIGPFPIRTASKTERIAEANRLLVKMDEEGQKINALPDGADKTAALKVFNDTKKILQDQIRYFKNGCDRATGMKTETYSVDRGPDRTRVVPCPS